MNVDDMNNSGNLNPNIMSKTTTNKRETFVVNWMWDTLTQSYGRGPAGDAMHTGNRVHRPM